MIDSDLREMPQSVARPESSTACGIGTRGTTYRLGCSWVLLSIHAGANSAIGAEHLTLDILPTDTIPPSSPQWHASRQCCIFASESVRFYDSMDTKNCSELGLVLRSIYDLWSIATKCAYCSARTRQIEPCRHVIRQAQQLSQVLNTADTTNHREQVLGYSTTCDLACIATATCDAQKYTDLTNTRLRCPLQSVAFPRWYVS